MMAAFRVAVCLWPLLVATLMTLLLSNRVHLTDDQVGLMLFLSLLTAPMIFFRLCARLPSAWGTSQRVCGATAIFALMVVADLILLLVAYVVGIYLGDMV